MVLGDYSGKRVSCNIFLGSATTIYVLLPFCFDGRARTSAHSSRQLASYER